MIDLKKLRELIKLMVSNDLTELDLQGEGERVTLKRGGAAAGAHLPPTVVAAPIATAVPQPPHGTAQPNGNGGASDDDTAQDDGLVPITSPMVGTYYARPGPDAKPFVTVGEQITTDQVICLIEAMKVFNEIKAETSGTVEKILVEDAQAVEFEQPLILVRPG